VVVEYDLENTGDRPIDYMREKLIVDGKTYESDGSVSYYLNPDDPMPVQPGMSGTVKTAFDVPADVAGRVARASSRCRRRATTRARTRSTTTPLRAASGWPTRRSPRCRPAAATMAATPVPLRTRACSAAWRARRTAVRATKQFFTAVRHRDASPSAPGSPTAR
jgi:hypothetical protein